MRGPFPNDLDDSDNLQSAGHANLSAEIERLVAAARRQLWVVGAAVILSLIAGVLFVLTRTPLYTTSAFVLIDNRHVRTVEQAYDATSTPDVAASVVDSQVEVLKSAQVAELVIRRTGFLNDPKHTEKGQPSSFGTPKSGDV